MPFQITELCCLPFWSGCVVDDNYDGPEDCLDFCCFCSHCYCLCGSSYEHRTECCETIWKQVDIILNFTFCCPCTILEKCEERSSNKLLHKQEEAEKQRKHEIELEKIKSTREEQMSRE